MMRASIWMAVTTVAIDRGMDFAGHKIEVKTRGRVDGPSAGGMMTIALMAALDGKTIPVDVAFTGTILPDGSIGLVGGVPHKIVGAAKAGKKRIISSKFQRVVQDPATETDVDLKNLCDGLKLEYIAVANVHEAYAAIMGSPMPQAPERKVGIPKSMDDLLDAFQEEEYNNAMKIWDGFTEEERTYVQNNPILWSLVQSLDVSRAALQINNTPAAYWYSSQALMILKGWDAFIRQTKAQGEAAVTAKIEALEKDLDSIGNAVLLHARFSPPVAIECFGDFKPDMIKGALMLLLVGDEMAANIVAGTDVVEQEQAFAVMAGIIFAIPETIHTIAKAQKVGANYPVNYKYNLPMIDRTNALLMANTQSQHAYIKTCIIQPKVEGTNMTEEQVAQMVLSEDFELGYAYLSGPMMEQIIAGNAGPKDPTEKALMTYFHLANIADTAALIMSKEAELYGETAAAGRMAAFIRSSREQCIRAINAGLDKGLPCWDSISKLYVADFMNDRQGETKKDILGLYILAGLEAKIGNLIFIKQ